ncbi:hypothetical protein EG68_01741 [Paragonimus skrjabini miyazakii]|uniref:Rho-GAP domain-containing protein n=1 Tax=Paragonimus skrjabini miyazakii TaxID=59628 RepID=A0A8S9Z5Q8_9TREM|nr:hypothetical protein EG68_01741 [Paragonimus skrjabini miyazakii]
MPLLANIRKCVAKRQNVQRRFTKVFFNVKIGDSFKSPNVPSQLRDLLVYIARDGVAVTDLFRRPGNPQDMKKIIAELEAGRMVNWREYNFYTLANIAKRYLLHIEGGILGRQAENYLIEMLESQDDQARIEAMHSVIVSQPKPVQQLLALLFGIWFRMIYHTEVNAMSVEAVAKSVAGSVFPSCTTTIQNVERASKVMEYLITGFASADLFSRELIEYFTTETKTSISRVEKFKYEFRFPKDVPREKSVRLFMRLLLEEGKKHGFHIINDAVSKEIFESANWETWCSPRLSAKHSPQEMSSTLTTADSKEDIPDEDRPSRHPVRSMNEQEANHRHPNVSTHSVQTTTTDDGALIGTKTSTILTPTLVRKSKLSDSPNKLAPLVLRGIESSDPSIEPVQQLSEMRTCVTTTPIRQQLPPLLQPPMEQEHLGNGTAESSSVPGAFRSRLPGTPAFNSHNGPDHGNTQTKLLARHAAPSSGCFNSVKRRQLERLQKRSDWFLSPPSGLRSSGLIHLDPNAIRGGDTRQHPNSAESDQSAYYTVSSDMLVDELDEHDPGCLHESAENLNDDDIDRLVLLDPVRVWADSEPDAIVSSRVTSSPKPNLELLGLKNNALINGTSSLNEVENFPEVETRYYVVERYYGPEPRTTFGNRRLQPDVAELVGPATKQLSTNVP